VVDVHSHFFPTRFLQALMREGSAHGVRVEALNGEWLIWNSPHQSARIGPVFYDVPARLEALDSWGISLQALSLSPPMLYWAPPALGRDLAQIFNDELAAICRAHPQRFVPLATLPLQDVDAAVAEAGRAVRAGCTSGPTSGDATWMRPSSLPCSSAPSASGCRSSPTP
jgi:aminocarboxymuconate-semialdehyde decarboxylase